MPNKPSNTFYVTVVTNKATDNVVETHTYRHIGHAKARRTLERKGGYYDAKVFKCLYGLGCMTAVEVEIP
jgi:hypothetical protein